jgi:hypothetical protein
MTAPAMVQIAHRANNMRIKTWVILLFSLSAGTQLFPMGMKHMWNVMHWDSYKLSEPISRSPIVNREDFEVQIEFGVKHSGPHIIALAFDEKLFKVNDLDAFDGIFSIRVQKKDSQILNNEFNKNSKIFTAPWQKKDANGKVDLDLAYVEVAAMNAVLLKAGGKYLLIFKVIKPDSHLPLKGANVIVTYSPAVSSFPK